jgi:glycosyltransferase involved in cell wall biosynthesis
MEEKTMRPTVSIIVPIYNAEKTLRRCLDSIAAQSWRQIEVLLVNDGSGDKSRAICQEYCQKDTRFHLIDKVQNSGVADSRNRAMAAATGKYLQFADSDDWLRPNATELMVEAAEQNHCELVVAGFYRVLERRIYTHMALFMEGKVSRARFVEGLMRAPANYYYGVLWNKLYRADIVRESNLTFPGALDWCEDTAFNLNYISHVKFVMVLREPVYFYTKQKGSLSSPEKVLPNMMEAKVQVFRRYRDLYRDTAKEENPHPIKPLNYWVAVPTDGGYSIDGYRNPAHYAERMDRRADRRQKRFEQKRKRRHRKRPGEKSGASEI